MNPVAPHMEDDTMKLGLLMEAAQAQQALAATSLDRLHEHTAGLDAIVREEIRATLVDEMRCLEEDSHRATEALRRLQRVASLRLALWSILSQAVATLVPVGAAWYVLPSRAEVVALGAQRDELTANIARLRQQGGDLELHRCGNTRRLCVRVDRHAPAYGENGEFLVVKGQ